MPGYYERNLDRRSKNYREANLRLTFFFANKKPPRTYCLGGIEICRPDFTNGGSRLMVNKQRAKAGEVAIGKRVETDTAEVAVPVERERVVIEHKEATNNTVVTPRYC